MKVDVNIVLIGLMPGILIGIIFAMCMTRIAARNAVGFGVECADKTLNNPKVSIDTTYIIHKQDTTSIYHFVKNK